MTLIDQFSRKINYLRISVTDRCDLRCVYCMKEKMQFLPRKDILTLEEIERLCDNFIELGIEKIRLTGGEPLVRNNIIKLIERLNEVLSKKFQIRNGPNNSEGIYDTFILFEKNQYIREKIINILKKYKFGTKNLPDAMEWHCAFYWNRALPKKQIRHVKKTKDILSTAIAIPIFLKRSLKDYKTIADKIHNLIN